jgi:hypothetical protein
VGELEKEVVRLKAWGAEKERYQFAEVGTGAFAYTLKPTMANGEPFHMLCANCHAICSPGHTRIAKGRRVHRCNRCKSEYELRGTATNPTPKRADTDFDVFTGE